MGRNLIGPGKDDGVEIGMTRCGLRRRRPLATCRGGPWGGAARIAALPLARANRWGYSLWYGVRDGFEAC
jgi:hypothetical protein